MWRSLPTLFKIEMFVSKLPSQKGTIHKRTGYFENFVRGRRGLSLEKFSQATAVKKNGTFDTSEKSI